MTLLKGFKEGGVFFSLDASSKKLVGSDKRAGMIAVGGGGLLPPSPKLEPSPSLVACASWLGAEFSQSRRRYHGATKPTAFRGQIAAGGAGHKAARVVDGEGDE